MEFERLQDALEFGRQTGSCYDLYDLSTGKVIDWNEINFRDEDEWYYDEKEYLWKKFNPGDGYYNGIPIRENHYSQVNIAAASCGVC